MDSSDESPAGAAQTVAQPTALQQAYANNLYGLVAAWNMRLAAGLEVPSSVQAQLDALVARDHLHQAKAVLKCARDGSLQVEVFKPEKAFINSTQPAVVVRENYLQAWADASQGRRPGR